MSGWAPTDGEVLTGRIVALDVAQSKQDGEPYPLVVIAPDGGAGEVTVHGHHRVLKEELAKRAPRVGDNLTITFLGKVTPDRGRAYSAYRVEGGSNPFTWNLFRDPADHLPAEHATGQPISSDPGTVGAGGSSDPAPTTQAAPAVTTATAGAATTADLRTIGRLLEAIWHKNSERAHVLEQTIDGRAGGPYRTHLTDESAAATVAWLRGKAAEVDVDVEAVLR